MKSLTQYTKIDFEKIAQDAITLSKKSEDELYKVMGHGLYDMGLKPSKTKNVLFDRIDTVGGNIRAIKAFGHVANTTALNDNQAKNKGKEFWKKFKESVKSIICSDKKILDFINGNGNLTLKDVLAYIIPIILVALGLTTLNPALLAVVVGAIAIILKSGFKAYCEI